MTRRTIYIIRHGEKPPDQYTGTASTTVGIDISGVGPNNSSLVPQGWQRAGALTTLFAPWAGQQPAWAMTPGELISPSYSDDPPQGQCSAHRTNQTIYPLSVFTNVVINNQNFAEGDEAQLGTYVAGETTGVTLICWEHTEIPAIANAIVGSAQQSEIPQSWPSNRFDVVWAFELISGAYTFTQYPEMLLAGDSPTTIPVTSSASH